MDPKEEERVFRKAFLDMTEMVRILYQERNEKLEGEGSKLHKEGQGSSRGQNVEDKSNKEMEEMDVVESHHPHPHHHHPLLHLQYISHTSQRTLVKVIF